MNDPIKALQAALGLKADGVRGPVTTAAILQAADQGRLVIGSAPKADELPWISEMKTVFGLHEVRDKAALKKWLRSDRKTLGDPDALPWCGDAMETAVKNSLPGEPFPAALGENPYWARNWVFFGVKTAAKYGAITAFERNGGGHIGILVGQDSTHFYVLGGNQGDSVSVVRIAKTRVTANGFRWPATYPMQTRPLPWMTPEGIPTSINEI